MVATGLLFFVVLGLSLLISLGGLAVAAVLLVTNRTERGVAIAVLAVAGLCFLATLAALVVAVVYTLGVI